MSKNFYELIALGARYLFAALMVLIVARAWRITVVDSRRAKTLRRLSPETGIVGELIVMRGDEKARRGMRYPVIREGMIGTARKADIRVRHSSVRRRHAWFQLTPEGLEVRVHAGAPMRGPGGGTARELTLGDGDVFDIGRVRLMLVLSVSPEEQRDGGRGPARRDDDWDGGDGAPDPGRMFREHPLLTHVAEAAPDDEWPDPDPSDGWDEPAPPDDLFLDD